MKFQIHTHETAPDGAKAALQAAEKSIGFVPNLLRVLAEAPIALEAYLDLDDLLGKASLNPVERQVMMLAGSFANDCGYCMAAHSTVARMVKMPQPVLQALRSGVPLPDARLEALRSFTAEMVQTRGRVSDARIQQFLDAGFTRQNVLEVVFAAAMKTLSNYANTIAETPVDEQFASETWNAVQATAA
jgi:uncharacterized peroxidase-related enzyme